MAFPVKLYSVDYNTEDRHRDCCFGKAGGTESRMRWVTIIDYYIPKEERKGVKWRESQGDKEKMREGGRERIYQNPT